ncbi:hypothetical protein AB0395_26125 [Streptosporangium sp. NPDC051023]|uniref:LppU/SCO3897 family protein n=1 Tax=Streptosporangium sp. NPDC051023 TaxID=3155410 RepID=UPI003450C465
MTETPQEPNPTNRKFLIWFASNFRTICFVFVVICGIGSFVSAYLNGEPQIAEVGDCMTGATTEELKVVECADPAATLKVAGRLTDKEELEWREDGGKSICSPFPGADQSYWRGEPGGKGFVLCMVPK